MPIYIRLWSFWPNFSLLFLSRFLSLHFSFPFPIDSNVQNSSSFQHMARMMDSLIMNDFPPYTFTKITTTHRPPRTSNGVTTTKLLTKSTANIPSTVSATGIASPLNNNGNVANGLRQTNQKPKVPTQGLYTPLESIVSVHILSTIFLLSFVITCLNCNHIHSQDDPRLI